MSKEQIETFLKIQTNLVKRNSEIVSTDDLGQNYMLHISHDNMSGKKYQPRIGERQDPGEDRTVPRITVSPYLIGCIHGFASSLNSLINYGKTGIFYIHKIPFEYCLKPTEKLVYDSLLSDEHWLVRYNQETTFYRPELVGKFVLTGLEIDFNHEYNDKIIKILLDQVTHNFFILPNISAPLGKSELEFRYGSYSYNLINDKDYKLKKSNKQISLENSLNNPNIYLKW